MKTVLRNSGFSLAMVACVGLFISAAWLWHRSLELGDFIYRTRPSPAGNTWRGVGSYHGAMLFGSLVDPTDARPAGYHHDAYPLTKESLVRIMPSYKASALGFGVTSGEMELALPFAFLLPRRSYHVTYVPYYCVMLLSILWPIGIARRYLRSQNATKASA